SSSARTWISSSICCALPEGFWRTSELIGTEFPPLVASRLTGIIENSSVAVCNTPEKAPSVAKIKPTDHMVVHYTVYPNVMHKQSGSNVVISILKTVLSCG